MRQERTGATGPCIAHGGRDKRFHEPGRDKNALDARAAAERSASFTRSHGASRMHKTRQAAVVRMEATSGARSLDAMKELKKRQVAVLHVYPAVKSRGAIKAWQVQNLLRYAPDF